jgi:hypothetical protein
MHPGERELDLCEQPCAPETKIRSWNPYRPNGCQRYESTALFRTFGIQ